MQLTLTGNEAPWQFDLRQRHAIAVALDFAGPQANLYGLPPAQAWPIEAGTLIGDTRQGGPINCATLQLTPHCNGTHTECIGHLTDERFAISEQLQQAHYPAALISVAPVAAGEQGNERYTPAPSASDRLITAAQLEAPLRRAQASLPPAALVVRTVPNPPSKQTASYPGDEPQAPYFTNDALELIHAHEIQHLLVDLPSIDRQSDEGRLSNHRIFWQLAPTGHATPPGARTARTITELIYVPDALADGPYLVELQVPAWLTDAAPSRVFLIPPLPAG